MKQKTQRAIKGVLGRAAATLGIQAGSISTPWLAARTWLSELKSEPLPPIKGRVAIMAFRNHTWIEWATYASVRLRSLGYAPVILFRGSDVARLYEGGIGKLGPVDWVHHGGFWTTVKQIPDGEFIDLDQLPAPTESVLSEYQAFAEDYAHTSGAYDLRVEELEGWPRQSEYDSKRAEYEDRLKNFGARVEHALKQAGGAEGLKRLIVYSGLIDVTAAAGEAAKRCDMDVVFVEGWAIKPGHMIASLNQPALVYDIDSWLKALGDWDEARDAEIDEFLKFQENPDLTNADWLSNYHQFQRTKSTDELPDTIREFIDDDRKLLLLTPNVVGDSATLRSRTIFRSQADWIEKICDYVKNNSHVKLLVRAHPDEHFLKNKVIVKMGEIAKKAASDAGNIRVILGSEDVSTYSLIPHAHLGLIWLSTVGVDMTVRGVPVLAAARPKYHGLGIVEEPTSQKSYFEALDRMIENPPVPTLDQTQIGRRYLTVIAREFSYEAFGKNYRASDLHFKGHPPDGDVTTFYRILAGDLPTATRPPARVIQQQGA